MKKMLFFPYVFHYIPSLHYIPSNPDPNSFRKRWGLVVTAGVGESGLLGSITISATDCLILGSLTSPLCASASQFAKLEQLY